MPAEEASVSSESQSVAIELLGDTAFRAVTDSAHEVVMEAASQVGGF